MRRGGGYGFRGQRNFRNEGRTSYDPGRNEGERNCDESPEPREDRPRRGGRPPWRRGRAYERERNSDESPAPREDRPRRGGLPPGLKGKEIGLYFRDRARRKKAAAARLGVSLDPKKEQQIRELLDSTRGLNSLFKDKSQESSPCTRYFSFSYMKSELKEEPEETITHNSGTGNNDVKNDDGSDFIKLEVKKEESPLDSDLEILPGPSEVKSENSIEDRYSHLGDSSFKRKFLQNISGSIETNLERSLLVNHKLVREEQLDKSFKEELLSKQNSFHYQKMAEFRAKLPSFKMQHQLLKLIEQNQVVVISGETGCGKTTQVAQFILDDYIMENKGSTCHIVCTQPRRISATSVAMRVADERDEVCGKTSVGYQIRLERKLPRQRGSILFCTTGILLQRMQTDPALREISHLVLDEIHERDVQCDFVLTILKDVIIKRPDLKIILMSATLNAEQFAKYFGNCPCINIPGYTFPVKEYYLEDAFEMTGYVINTSQKPGGTGRVWKKYTKFGKLKAQKVEAHRDLIEPYIRQLESEGKYSWETLEMLKDPESEEINLEFVAALIHHICRKKSEGAILVFLPGWDNISTLHKIMTESGRFHPSHCLIIPLHSMMPTVVQRSVFDRPPAGIRKIIIATNIAETSITIDDVVYVIDCGKIKLKNFDVENNISTLKPEWVSLANARQRKGRAGRVQPGECYHLYTKAREMSLANYPLPEMLRTRLEEVILQIKILQLGKVKPFLQKVMDPPDPRAVDLSVKLLENLNALDSEENLTPLGFHLANLPVDPQTGKMILMGALFSCVDPIFSVAASLSFKDAFHIPLGQEEKVNQKKKELSRGEKSDHLVLVEALRQWEEAEEMRRGRDFCWEYFLSSNTLSMLRDMKGQFAEHLQGMNFLSSTDPKAADSNINSHNISLVKAIICAGLYPNVAIVRKIIRKRGEVFVKLHTPEDGTVCIHPRSINEKQPKFESPFLLYHMKLKSTNIYLHDTTMVYPLPLLFFGKGVDVRIEDGHEIIAVDNAVGFKCERKTANLVKELRKRLDQLLEYKITHPGTIDWKRSTESAVLKAIIELITSEDNDMMLVAREDNFSD